MIQTTTRSALLDGRACRVDEPLIYMIGAVGVFW